jgi:putative oxidoreductase
LPTLARVLLCSLFIWEGVLQLRNPAGTVNYFTSLDIPAPQIAVWVSIAVHLLGGVGILVGFMTRWAAALLILLCRGTAFGVHLPAGDMENMTHFYKNPVMAGGLLYVIASGPGAFAFDRTANNCAFFSGPPRRATARILQGSLRLHLRMTSRGIADLKI